jgi:hypothetical protein
MQQVVGGLDLKGILKGLVLLSNGQEAEESYG